MYPQTFFRNKPKECKALGRSREIPFDNDIWDQNKEKIYYEVLIDKFKLPKLKSIILSTEDKILVEASPFDKIWGIGMAHDNPSATKPEQKKAFRMQEIMHLKMFST